MYFLVLTVLQYLLLLPLHGPRPTGSWRGSAAPTVSLSSFRHGDAGLTALKEEPSRGKEAGKTGWALGLQHLADWVEVFFPLVFEANGEADVSSKAVTVAAPGAINYPRMFFCYLDY